MIGQAVVAFDYDGVLLDSAEHNIKAACYACEQIKYSKLPCVTDLQYLPTMSFEALAHQIKMPKHLHKDFVYKTMAYLDNTTDKVDLFAGIEQTLKRLSKIATLVIITANHESVVKPTLNRKGINKYFTQVLGEETAGNKADKLKKLQKDMSINANSIFMIGDATSDIKHALQADVQAIGVTWGYQPFNHLKSANPHHIFNTQEALVDFLNKTIAIT